MHFASWRQRMVRRAGWLVVVVVAGLLGPVGQSAFAGTARITPGGVLEYRAAATSTAPDPGETNTVTITASGASFGVSDATAPVTAGRACVATTANAVSCTGAVVRIFVDAGAGDDSITNDTAIPSTLLGGDGNDTILGGAAADTIRGNAGVDVIDGRAGDDTIVTRGDVSDAVTCGPGNDTAIVDLFDRVAADCENVDTGAPPP